MAYTVQQCLDDARIPLNDTDKDRYTDDVLLKYFNDAVLMARKLRPDLFLGQWSALPSNLVGTDAFPVDEIYFPLFCDYVTGRAETIDDENVENTRAATFIQNFLMGLRS